MSSIVDGKTFSPRARVPTAGVTNPSHPQLTLTPDGGAVIVWDEVMNGTGRVSMTRVCRAGAFMPPQVLSEREPASFPVTVLPATGDLGDTVLGFLAHSPSEETSSTNGHE